MMADVTKRYRGRGGIEQVSLSVAGGEVLAFLGPNGAGKTTTIRLLLDLIRPEAGQVRLFGLDPRADGTAVRRRVGYLPGELSLYDRLTARELLTHFAHLRGGTAAHPFARVADRVGMIRAGRLLRLERVEDLRQRSVHRVAVRLGDDPPRPLALLPGVRLLADLSGAVGRQGTGSGATTMAPAAPEGGATDGDGTPPTS